MSVSGTFLMVITASFLKPLQSTNQSLQLPTEIAYDEYNNDSPFKEADGANPGLFLTLRLPQLLANTNDVDMKRQFDPWGGKRHLKSEDEDIGRKRQFSPWGGKRSPLKNSQFLEENFTDEDSQLTNSFLSENKKSFNSWGGKKRFNSRSGKRDSWGDRISANSDTSKRFNAWGGKRNFNSWGGKRSTDYLNENTDILSLIPKKNSVLGSKRQSFNSWGGKRLFNSWGGKRGFNSWGGKRGTKFEQEPKQLDILENNSILQAYKGIVDGTETNIR